MFNVLATATLRDASGVEQQVEFSGSPGFVNGYAFREQDLNTGQIIYRETGRTYQLDPEPSPWTLAGLGAAAALLVARRRS